MNKTLKKILFALEIVALVLCAFWWYNDNGYEPIIVLILVVVSIVGTYFIKEKKDKSKSQDKNTFSQKAGKKSKQYMSKGDMKINNK